ncbi:MAG: FMN-binding protein [Eubacteriales bacterium]|nr:FMN-binding protein [Eubacteriales bacterium]
MNTQKNQFAAPVIVLSAICLVVSIALAFTNRVTSSIIEANNEATAAAARTQLLSAADSFTKVEDVTPETGATSEDGKATVQDAYAADNGAGYVMTVKTSSFGGALTMMVGLDSEGAITGVTVTEHADTPGVGTKDMEPDYLAQYQGMSELSSAANIKKEAAPFVYISGASVSGQAIHSGVAAALSQYAAMGGAQ